VSSGVSVVGRQVRLSFLIHHIDADIEHPVQALAEIWAEVGLAKAA
jgi:5-aminolevulinate synthase